MNKSALSILISLMMVLMAFSAMGQSYNSAGATGLIQRDQAQQPQSITVLNPVSNATINKPYNFEVESFSQFTYLNVSFGDNSPNKSIAYAGSDYVNISHTYDVYGTYFINITASYASPASNYSVLLSVNVGWGSVNSTQAVGYASILPAYSSLPVYNNSNIFSPGANISLYVYYLQSPSNYTYGVYFQNITMWRNGAIIKRYSIPYVFNSTDGYYTAGYASSIVNRTDLGPGVYEFNITTFTGKIGTSGSVTNKTALSYIMDVAVEKGLTIFPSPSNGQSLTNAEDTDSGYVTFDGQIAYDTVSNEILDNTYLFLDSYNGSSSSSFVPMLASQLPAIANGGINGHSYSRTVRGMNSTGYANGSAVTYTYQPYQVYNFTIRSNATWQNGTPVTAYDVAYGIIRDLLFINGQPGTPGWILGQVLLPNYAAFAFTDVNSFYNLTTNITWNNATNTVTFYLQAPESPQFVYELFAASGAYIMDPAWIAAHGGGITWTPAGFAAYRAEANETGYDKYFMNHIFADGPYELAYAIPGNLVVLRANPDYNPPGSWFPRPSISTITILYLSDLTDQSYFLLKSDVAQIGGIPRSTWSAAVSLQDAGTVDIHSFPSLNLYFYNFNADVNTTMAASAFPGINMPSALFAAPLARKAFAYAYNYAYYLKDQEGNPLYPNTVFAYSYAGMLPAGMLYSQSIAQLNNTTNGVPYYDMGLAIHYWDEFLNSTEAANMSITHSSNMIALYNGKMLEIPIVVFPSDPQDYNGATTWGISLAQMMGYGAANHTQFPATPISFVKLLTYQEYGQNPMPIYELGWAPDYPYPSDYMGPMADPSPSALYPGANAMFPAYIQTVNATESSILAGMANIFDESQAAANPATAESLYHQLNEQLINMTFYVYLYQAPEYIISSSSLIQAKMVQYQENVMIGGGGDFLYNLVSYGSNVQTYTVTFSESGLVSGTSWSVDFNGTTQYSDSSTISFTIPNGTYSFSISSNSTYFAFPKSGNLTVSGNDINLAIYFSPYQTIGVGARPDFPLYDPGNGLIYVPLRDFNAVNVLNGATDRMVSSIKVGSEPEMMALDSANGLLYVTDYGGSNVTVINSSSNRVTGSITVGSSPYGIAYDYLNGNFYVSNYKSGNVTIIKGSSGTVIGSVNVGLDPIAVTFAPDVDRVYVANSGSSNITVISGSTNKVVASVNAGAYFRGYGFEMAYDFSNTYLYAVNSDSNTVSVINTSTNRIIASVATGNVPEGIAYDSSNGYLYVADSSSNNVTVINGETNSVVSTLKDINNPNSVTYDQLNGYVYVGEWSFGGLAVIPNHAAFTVTFHEKGLPENSLWYVNVTGMFSSGPVAGDFFNISLQNGTYNYSISSADKNYAPGIYTGSVTVSDSSPPEIVITFALQTFPVTFSETGLPAGTEWYVNITGSSPAASTSTSMTFNYPNGTYIYTISTVDKIFRPSYTGRFTVQGKPVPENVTFAKLSYKVTFGESGLPSGTTWYVNITGGNDYSSSNSTISFYSTNGTFTYVISRPPLNYVLPVSSGVFTIDGKAVTVQIVYDRMALVQFIVNPNDATLSINGVNQTMSSGSLSLYLNAGYYYINATDIGYLPYSNYVHLSYNGSYSYSISLKPVSNSGYLVGTILPENATVSANGIIIPVSHGYFNASLSPGTYYVTATAYGYESGVSVVNITAGHASNLAILLKPSTSSSVIISGYIDPVNASLTVNGFDAYVNSTGYFHVSLPAGTYTVSAYENGYYPYSVTRDFTSSTVINITLKPEPASTSTTSSSNVTSTGFNVTVSNITTANGKISLKYSATSNGTVVVQIPYADMRNATISEILGSKVYVNGTLYSNFSITITSNYTIILTVYGLNGDPVLTWAYIPSVSVTPPPPAPPPAAPPPASTPPYLIYAIVAIVIVAAIAGVLVARRRKQ